VGPDACGDVFEIPPAGANVAGVGDGDDAVGAALCPGGGDGAAVIAPALVAVDARRA
jgi:hypothetical protein